LALQFR